MKKKKKKIKLEKKYKKIFHTWRPSKKFSPIIITVCPPLVHPSVGEMALIIGDTAPGYMPEKYNSSIKNEKKKDYFFADVYKKLRILDCCHQI